MLTRRDVLHFLPAAAPPPTSDSGNFPSELRRYPDPATENEVIRLTDPLHRALLPAAVSRPVSSRGNFLLHLSDRGGPLAVFRLDLKSGVSRQLTRTANLDPLSVSLLPDERAFCYRDGDTLELTSLGIGRTRKIYTWPTGVRLTSTVSIADDGVTALICQQDPQGRSAVKRLSLVNGTAPDLVTSDQPVEQAIFRPRTRDVAYRQGRALFLNGKPLPTAAGSVGPLTFTADGTALVYLVDGTLREYSFQGSGDRLLAKTSQFARFGRNADASVFVGASASKASPLVLLLLRVTRRELALCEHKASDAQQVNVLFSPNSQRVYFQSDRHGAPAIYSIRVDRLVEETE